MIKELIERLNTAPNYDDYRQLTYELIEQSMQIAEIKILIAGLKNSIKDDEADILIELKTQTEKKMTLPEIDAVIRFKTEKKRNELNQQQVMVEKIVAQYEATQPFLRAVDGSLFYLNNTKNNV